MTDKALTVHGDMTTMEVGKVLADSRYFADAAQVSQAVVKVLAGRELGFGPIVSMTGIHIIKGKPAIGANLMAAAVKKSGRYNYKVRELTNEVARIEFFERNGDKFESAGVSEFTLAQARSAGTQNLDKFARNMLFARAMSNGVRWYCPDVLGGGAVYTPEELGAKVDEEGEVISGTVNRTEEEPQSEPAVEMTYEQACEYTTPKGVAFVSMKNSQLGWVIGESNYSDDHKKAARIIIDHRKAEEVKAAELQAGKDALGL